MVSEVIIIGGGASILPWISSLQPVLDTHCGILTNYAYKRFNGTFTAFTDRAFYKPKPDDNNPDIYEELRSLPLIVGINDNGISEFKMENTVLVKRSSDYHRQHSLRLGFYTGNLTGIFSIGLASYLMKYVGTIYLLGFDWSKQPIPKDKKIYKSICDMQIHFYNDIKHRGVGYTGYYDVHNPSKLFKYFLEPKLKIYNVGLESNINTFEKIDYPTFFKLAGTKINPINQNELRQKIILKLTGGI
jgi:hypothetical protein